MNDDSFIQSATFKCDQSSSEREVSSTNFSAEHLPPKTWRPKMYKLHSWNLFLSVLFSSFVAWFTMVLNQLLCLIFFLCCQET